MKKEGRNGERKKEEKKEKANRWIWIDGFIIRKNIEAIGGKRKHSSSWTSSFFSSDISCIFMYIYSPEPLCVTLHNKISFCSSKRAHGRENAHSLSYHWQRTSCIGPYIKIHRNYPYVTKSIANFYFLPMIFLFFSYFLAIVHLESIYPYRK